MSYGISTNNSRKLNQENDVAFNLTQALKTARKIVGAGSRSTRKHKAILDKHDSTMTFKMASSLVAKHGKAGYGSVNRAYEKKLMGTASKFKAGAKPSKKALARKASSKVRRKAA